MFDSCFERRECESCFESCCEFTFDLCVESYFEPCLESWFESCNDSCCFLSRFLSRVSKNVFRVVLCAAERVV